jgi:hypothetical protein
MALGIIASRYYGLLAWAINPAINQASQWLCFISNKGEDLII